MADDPNLDNVLEALDRLGSLAEQFVFVGGCAVGLLITDRAAPSIRETYDVDAIVSATTIAEYYKVSQALRERGFKEDKDDPDAPICRWRSGNIILDVMPSDRQVLGFGSDWYPHAITTAQVVTLPHNRSVRLISAPYFLITKLNAFDSRGREDYLFSRDIEDLVAVVDGRPEIVSEVAQADRGLKAALGSRIRELLDEPRFRDALPGYIRDDGSPSRVGVLDERLAALLAACSEDGYNASHSSECP